MEEDDKNFMQEALVEARKAFGCSEVPVGAVLVKDGVVIARAYNQVETLQKATAHAERLCLDLGAKNLNNWRLNGTTLYTTLEPCIMCTGAIILSRVERVVWGAKDLRHGGSDNFADHQIHTVEMLGGVLEQECAELVKTFFQRRRCGTII